MSQEKATFFWLPREIRDAIYKDVLVFRKTSAYSYAFAERNRRNPLVSYKNDDEPFTPALLRTCKQVCLEAASILYGENRFAIHEPGPDIEWLEQIGPRNVGFLGKLDISIPCSYSSDQPQWLLLLAELARKATRIRVVTVHWEEFYGRGRGDDMVFMKALGNIKAPYKMKLEGYFAKDAQTYLEHKMGMKLWYPAEHDEKWLRRLERYQSSPKVLRATMGYPARFDMEDPEALGKV